MLHTLCFSHQNAVYFIMLPSLVTVLFAFYIQGVLKFKCKQKVNPLNAELNPICNLLILLGDLTFNGPCIVSISNKMQRHTVYLYLETALQISGGNFTHHQERIQLYLQNLLFVTPLLLSAAISGTGLSVLWVAYATHSTLKPVRTLPR
jgi:hypothetical protein